MQFTQKNYDLSDYCFHCGYCYCYYYETGAPCRPTWPGTYYRNQIDLDFTESHLLQPNKGWN